MIAGACQNSHAVLKYSRSQRGEIGEAVRGGVPESQQCLARRRLAQPNERLATRKRQRFGRTDEDDARNRRKTGDRVARLNLQGTRADGQNLL
jgi:hypothetical protein